VDAINAPHAQTNIRGTLSAYRKVGAIRTFDYRAVAHHFGPKVPWSRPEIWGEKKWNPMVTRALRRMNRALIEEARWYKPSFIHLGKCELVSGSTVRALKSATHAFVAHFYGDLSREVKPWVAEIGRFADITLLIHRDPAICRAYSEAGCRKIGFWWVGTDPTIFYPREVQKRDYSLIFMGRPIQESGNERRITLIEMAQANVVPHVFGGNWDVPSGVHCHPFVDEDAFAWACSRAKIALSINAHDVPMYASWRRIFNTMACGTLLLVRYFPGLETVFENKKHLVWYKERTEAVRLARHYLVAKNEREQIAEVGRQEVLARHTWDHRIAEMLRFADGN
jgi:hypothetical protein